MVKAIVRQQIGDMHFSANVYEEIIDVAMKSP